MEKGFGFSFLPADWNVGRQSEGRQAKSRSCACEHLSAELIDRQLGGRRQRRRSRGGSGSGCGENEKSEMKDEAGGRPRQRKKLDVNRGASRGRKMKQKAEVKTQENAETAEGAETREIRCVILLKYEENRSRFCGEIVVVSDNCSLVFKRKQNLNDIKISVWGSAQTLHTSL